MHQASGIQHHSCKFWLPHLSARQSLQVLESCSRYLTSLESTFLSIFKLSLTAMLLFNSAGWHDGKSKRIITQVSSITSIIIQPDDTGTGLVLVKVLVSKGGGIIVNLSFVCRYILGEADHRHMLENLPDNKALEVGLKNGTSPIKCLPFSTSSCKI